MRKLTFMAVAALALIFAVPAMAQEETTAPPEKKEAVKVKEAVEKPALMVEAELCTGIEERMPTGMADTFAPDVENVYLWCKVIGCKDTTVVHHVWYYKGDQMADVELPVRSPAWRTYSSKKILPSWTGDWEVKIVDADGNEMKSIPFKIAAPE
ncbi:MAG TPA: DUF2914 domain-containing protein [candidate division Zixibacteria bacterium]|nr:DUF2914 domain-containing protein [candidate division Zixibacteria bacterium]